MKKKFEKFQNELENNKSQNMPLSKEEENPSFNIINNPLDNQ